MHLQAPLSLASNGIAPSAVGVELCWIFGRPQNDHPALSSPRKRRQLFAPARSLEPVGVPDRPLGSMIDQAVERASADPTWPIRSLSSTCRIIRLIRLCRCSSYSALDHLLGFVVQQGLQALIHHTLQPHLAAALANVFSLLHITSYLVALALRPSPDLPRDLRDMRHLVCWTAMIVPDVVLRCANHRRRCASRRRCGGMVPIGLKLNATPLHRGRRRKIAVRIVGCARTIRRRRLT